MEDIYFQVYDEDDNLIAEIQVFDDMNSWVTSHDGHKIIFSINNDHDFSDTYEEDFDDDEMNELYNETIDYLKNDYGNKDKGSHLVDGMLDYLDKHNRNTGY